MADVDHDQLRAEAKKLSAEIKATGYTAIWYRERVVRLLYRIQGGECAICGDALRMRDATIDHVTPLAVGGRNDLSNFVLAHEGCNHAKGTCGPSPREMAVHRSVLEIIEGAGEGHGGRT